MNNQESPLQARNTSWKRRRAFLLTACLLIVILILGTAVYKGNKRLKSAPNWRPRPVPVTTDSVRRTTLRQTLSYLARLESVATSEISPELNARILKLYADDGDRVEAGALLAKLDDREIRFQMDTLKARINAQRSRIQANRAALESAQGTVSFLKRETARDQELFEQKGISASALDAGRDQLDSAVGKARALVQESKSLTQEVKALSAQLEETRVRLSYTEVRSPVKGTIRRRYVEVGDMVNPATPLFSFMDLSAYRLAFTMVQEDLVWVRPGQKVLIRWPIDPSEDKRIGKLARIFPSLGTEKTVRAEIDLSCQCPEGLKIGTFVPIKVVLREGTGLTVPRRAIVPLPEQKQGVYVVRSDKLALVGVETDFFNETRALVRGDLEEGEPVVVGEYLQWVRHHQGQPVEVQK